MQHLGDVTIRVRKATAAPTDKWTYYASAWGPFSAEATAVSPLPAGAIASHDISALLAATNITEHPPDPSWATAMPLSVTRSYSKPASGSGLEISFELK